MKHLVLSAANRIIRLGHPRFYILLSVVAVMLLGVLYFWRLSDKNPNPMPKVNNTQPVRLSEWQHFVRGRWSVENFPDKHLRSMYLFITEHEYGKVVNLLKSGVSPNISDQYGDTPLLLAFCYDEKIFRKLLDEGADAAVPIDIDFENGGLVNDGDSVLSLAASMSGPWFEILQKYPMDVNHRGLQGNTLTHEVISGIAFGNEKVERLKWLIANGANLDLKNDFNDTPLDVTLKPLWGMTLVEILIENGGTPDRREDFDKLLKYIESRTIPPHSNPNGGGPLKLEALELLQRKYQEQFGESFPYESN